MKVQKVYKTSRGTFWSKVDAEKKANRTKTSGSRPDDPVEYEQVQEVFVLIADIQIDQGVQGIGTECVVFELSNVDVK